MGRRVIAALGLGVLALAGCSPVASGEAAVSDEFRVSQSDVDAEVSLYLEAVGQPTAQPPEGLATATTQRLVQDALFAAKAAELGVEVTQGQVDQLIDQNGGQDVLDQVALQRGIAPASAEVWVRTSLLLGGIGSRLDPGADAAVQSEAALAALAEYSESIDVQVAPRYGTWDDTKLSIVPGSPVVSSPTEAAQP